MISLTVGLAPPVVSSVSVTRILTPLICRVSVAVTLWNITTTGVIRLSRTDLFFSIGNFYLSDLMLGNFLKLKVALELDCIFSHFLLYKSYEPRNKNIKYCLKIMT